MRIETLRAAEDNDLARQVAYGEVRAFEELYDRHSAQAFALALYITQQPGVAEEVTQDAFLGLWRSASLFDANRGALKT